MKWIRFAWHILIRTTYDGTLIRASALTYQTLLAIVPLLAIMLAIAKGFGLQNLLEQTLQREFRDQKEILQYLLTFSNNTLDQLREGALAIVGLLALFFTVTRLLASFEEALNSMWGINERRSFLRMISAHITLVLVGPILFALSSSISIFFSSEAQAQPEDGLLIEVTRTFYGNIIHLIPYLTIAFLFTLLLYTLPARRPNWYEALIAGAIGAIAFQVLQETYISLQLKMTKMSTVWGSFVALPLFLAWLWASWAIVLASAQLCVAIHEKLWRYSVIQDAPFTPLVKLAYMTAIVEFATTYLQEKQRCPSVDMIGISLETPQRVLNPFLLELQAKSCIMIAPADVSHHTLVAPLVDPNNEKKLLSMMTLTIPKQQEEIPNPIQNTYMALRKRLNLNTENASCA